MDETKRAADELATKGFIDSGRRRNLYGLKQQYNQNVVPLQNQLKIRQERAEELRRMQLQDPTFRATLNPNEIGLTSGLKNPEAFNYSGVSGNQMYKSVAEKANQLSKVIEQEHPELIKSGLSYNYFTAVQSGASLEQVDAAMRRQFNPKDVDKMTNLMRGVVESTFNEFGVSQKFANNPKVQDELWQTASQGLYAALGSKQFGTMHDSWGEGNARRAQENTPPPPPKILREFNPDFNKEAIDSLDKLAKNAKKKDQAPAAPIKYDPRLRMSPEQIAEANKVRSNPNQMSVSDRKAILDIGRNFPNIRPPKISSNGNVSKSEWDNYVDLVIEEEKKRYQSLNMTSYSENTNDVVENALSKLSAWDEKIKNTSGDKISEFTIEPNTKSSISWNAKTGDVNLRFTPKGKTKRESVGAPADIFGDAYVMELQKVLKYFNDLSKDKQLNEDELNQYESYSREFDNAMNQITNTQQSVYNYQPAK